jgi:hypothetical protein
MKSLICLSFFVLCAIYLIKNQSTLIKLNKEHEALRVKTRLSEGEYKEIKRLEKIVVLRFFSSFLALFLTLLLCWLTLLMADYFDGN